MLPDFWPSWSALLRNPPRHDMLSAAGWSFQHTPAGVVLRPCTCAKTYMCSSCISACPHSLKSNQRAGLLEGILLELPVVRSAPAPL
jgi:hypothetical protein